MKNNPPIDQPYRSRNTENFKIEIFEAEINAEGEFEKRNRNAFFEIIWLKYGSGVHEIDMREHAYSGSVLFFLAPGQVHKIMEFEKSEGYVLKFLPSLFNQERDFVDYLFEACLLDSNQTCPVIGVPEHLKETMQQLFDNLLKEFEESQRGTEVILGAYLKILTTHARRIKDNFLLREAYTHKPQHNLFRRFKIAVEHHYKTKHAVQDYAQLLKSPARVLNAVSRKFADRSALEIIQERIVLEAKRRLSYADESVKELGYELGFDDPAYFTRFFKKNVGMAPQFYRTEKIMLESVLT